MKFPSFDSLHRFWKQRVWRVLVLASFSFTLTIALAHRSAAVLLPTPVDKSSVQQTVKDPPVPLQVAQLIGISDSQYQRLAEADRFYMEGNLQMAEKIAREVKPPFKGGEMAIPQPIVDVESNQLAPAARVYWRNGLEGMQQNLESKIFKPLQLLTQNYPDFIPGHIKLAEACEKDPKGCQRNADADQPDNAVDVLQRASSLYPESTEVLDALLATLDRAANASSKDSFEYFLDASIAARQFALTYPEHPRASQYADLANAYMQQYQRTLNSVIQGYIIGGSIIGNSRDVLTLNQLLQGEAAYGQTAAQEYREQLRVVNDPTLQAYVNEVGWKMARQMGRDEFNYEFTIFEGGPFDAFALPGGKVFISTGTIRTCRSEAELAGILGHEVAHTALSHSFRKIAETTVMKVFSRIIPLGKDLTGMAASQFSQTQERQADLMATRSLAQTRYAADGLWSVMLTLREATRNQPVPWLASHPAPPDRVRYLENLITRNNYNRYAYSGVMHHAQALGLVPAETVATSSNPQDGNSFAPSGSAPASSSSTSGNSSQPTRKNGAQRPVGDVPLTAMIERRDVTIRVDSANVSRTGTYTLNLSIENRSDRSFAFVPLFAEVLNSSGEKIKARYTFETGDSGSVLAEPGQTLRGQVTILGQPWVTEGKQELILLIKEGTSNGRVFRIPI